MGGDRQSWRGEFRVSAWVGPVHSCFDGTTSNPCHPELGLEVVAYQWHVYQGHSFGCTEVWQPLFFLPPPTQRLLASHPTYFLLGFSAARAPKFTPHVAQMWALFLVTLVVCSSTKLSGAVTHDFRDQVGGDGAVTREFSGSGEGVMEPSHVNFRDQVRG